MTLLFPSPVFGPVHSRRLGISLGINLLPGDGKVCNFDCIYCECGFNRDFPTRQRFPGRDDVAGSLDAKLRSMQAEGRLPDVITFAGNGEPTLHPQFPAIIDDTLRLRDQYCPQARVSVLSNGTRILDPAVFEALKRVDNNILKLDTVSTDYIRRVDRPHSPHFELSSIVSRMADFQGRCIVQTMFLEGTYEGCDVSNLSDRYVQPWLQAVCRIQPSEVMIYTIERDTPSPHLRKAAPAHLDRIAALVRQAGLPCQVSY